MCGPALPLNTFNYMSPEGRIARALMRPPSPRFVNVHSYLTDIGTLVEPHHRTVPNALRRDNYTAAGSYNAFTLQPGYRRW